MLLACIHNSEIDVRVRMYVCMYIAILVISKNMYNGVYLYTYMIMNLESTLMSAL